VMDSGDALWRAYFDKPFDEVRASPETKARLEEALFLKPEPYVSRLVMIATPHRGSIEASIFPGLPLRALIHRPEELREMIREVSRENGPEVGAPGVRTREINGLGNLNPRDPALAAILPIPLCVPYHSIIPQLTIAGYQLKTDGVVPYYSSHLDGAESETITPGFHTSHDSWPVCQEVKRILRQHLCELAAR